MRQQSVPKILLTLILSIYSGIGSWGLQAIAQASIIDIETDRGPIRRPRDDGDEIILNSITLSSSRPIFVWDPVEGATLYSLDIQGPGVNCLSRVFEARLVYPGDCAPLQSGKLYTLKFTAQAHDEMLVQRQLGLVYVDETSENSFEGYGLKSYVEAE